MKPQEKDFQIRQELLQKHRTDNLFASFDANPWDNSTPDVFSLNQDVYEQIFTLLQTKAKFPRTPLACLILGEIGTGKTHMLKRILARIQQDQEGFKTLFVYAKASRAHEKMTKNLWHEIFANLCREHRNGIPQFNVLVGKMMSIYRHSNASKGVNRFDSAEGIRYFQSRLPEIHTDFLKAIFAYYGSPSDSDTGEQEERRQAALQWLQGNWYDEQVSLLGVEDRSSMSAEELEEEARKLILSLGLVLDLCKISMVICFDQLDEMEDNPKLAKTWGQMVAFLIDFAFSILPLTFVKEQVWKNSFKREIIGDYVDDRLRGHRFFLKLCTAKEAQQLIYTRIFSHFGEDANEKYEWLMKQLDGKLKNGLSPRIVLQLVIQVLETDPGSKPETQSPGEVLEKQYQKECNDVTAIFAAYLPDMDRLFDALEIYLNNHSKYKAIQADRSLNSLSGRRIDENAAERDCMFIINTEGHFMKVAAALKRGIAFLEGHPRGICYYISDDRRHFPPPPRWPKIHEHLIQFKNSGGTELFLKREQAVYWYALNELRIKVKSGDVTLLSSDGEERTVSMDDLKTYLKHDFKTDLLEFEKSIEKSAPAKEPAAAEPEVAVKEAKNEGKAPLPVDKKDENDDELAARIFEVLNNSPMRFMTVEILLAHLSAKGTVTREQLLESVGKQGDTFSTYPTGDGTIVMLK